MPETLLKPAVVFAAAACYLVPQWNRATGAVSHEAEVVRNLVQDAGRRMESSQALFGKKDALLSALNVLAQGCSTVNWDGFDAVPVSPAALARAGDFIRAIPDSLPLPEISAEPDGSIVFDWIPGPFKTLSVSISASQRIPYAMIDGTDRVHAALSFVNGMIPIRLLEEIKRITTNGSAFRTT